MAIDADHPAKQVKSQKSTIIVTRPLTEGELTKTGLAKKKIIFDARNGYTYFKVTKDKRILAGFGTLTVPKKHKKKDPHFPHLKNIKTFLKKLFPYLNLRAEYAWSGTFGVTKNYQPFVQFKGNTVTIAGAATQVACFMTAKHAVSKMLGQK